MVAYWKDRDGNKMNYWPGGKGLGCACGVDKSCVGGELANRSSTGTLSVARCDKAMVRLNKKYVLSKFMDKDACMPRVLGMY